jgi:alkanesulfonate monooxygenase SsuD/methylene tetrahydromethanopterin reductase-like flavin-dependent oxidoreductase (luciferase family)
MELGAFTVVDQSAGADPATSNRLVEVVRLAERAEQAGLSSFWVAEHHFQGGGACPSPAVVLAACGMRTRTLRLGSLVSVLPFHRAVDIAEEYAVVDRLTHGRLNLGVGSGYIASELEGFGIDPAGKRERFDATLSSVLEAFAGRPIRAEPGSPPVLLNVRPVQRPHPPLWIAAQRREAIPFVARKGASLALIPYATVERLDELREEIAEYRQALPSGVSGRVAVAVHVYTGDHPERGRAAFRRYVESRLATGSPSLERKTHDHPAHSTPEAIERHGLVVFGSPSAVVDGLERFEGLGVDDLLGIFDFGGLPEEEVAASVLATGQAWASRSGAGPTPPSAARATTP